MSEARFVRIEICNPQLRQSAHVQSVQPHWSQPHFEQSHVSQLHESPQQQALAADGAEAVAETPSRPAARRVRTYFII